ncbi:MAG TPA: hypothetical protein VJ813_18455 [Vicinamibacterales bacterium]|nr:hypothetical protein [Vicinamibacterales bacterium]
MRRAGLFGLAIVAAGLLTILPADAVRQVPASPQGPTCDETGIMPDSYRLTTEAQSMNVLRPREPWWEPFGVWKEPREIGNLNQGSVRLAERARELDERNLLAHGYLARQYVVMAVDATKAERAWERVLDNGSAIVWTATLLDIDPRSFFLVAFDRESIRIFRFGQIAGPLRTHFGVPDFPGPERVDLWRALGGCLPVGAVPEAEFPWSSVREIRATRWALRFELDAPITVRSDRGERRSDDTLEINLHGQTGGVDFRFAMTPFARAPFNGRPIALDPAAYQNRVLQMLGKFFDPDQRLRIRARSASAAM